LRRVLALALAAAACLAHAGEDRFPRVAQAYYVQRDGRLLWAGQERERLPIASLAKMMTALLALERGRLDEIVAVSPAASRATGTRLGLRQGERLRARELLVATVVRSANDACRALAEHVGGSAEGFVAMMNERAAAERMVDTRFADPCGHDREGQHSSAADLARLAERLILQPEYLRLARLPAATIRTADGRRSFAVRNTNALLGRFEGALGLKTGYTEGAGNCLVALAERNGSRVLVVLLNAPNRWWNAVGLLERAFEAPAP
jgi:serine-type D-Ala-D-Ala carboxypeptidase (penicillin-binding protein 5/6)